MSTIKTPPIFISQTKQKKTTQIETDFRVGSPRKNLHSVMQLSPNEFSAYTHRFFSPREPNKNWFEYEETNSLRRLSESVANYDSKNKNNR